MRMKAFVFIGLSLVMITHGAPQSDGSFEKMCNFYHGGYQQRQSKGVGDTCKLDLPTSTSSELQAETFCNEYFPYHIVAVQHGKRTKCTAEATLVCEPEWVQMYGRCYKITRKQLTYDDAKKTCAAELNGNKKPLRATIAFLHRTALVGRWRDYFKNVFRIWVDGSEVYTDNLLYNEGPNMLLAINGYRYGVKNMALVRVPETETAMALCEYTPPANPAESNHIAKRYNEIYYPAVSTEEGTYVRSASSRHRDNEDRLADTNYCKGVLSPFLRAIGAQSAIPTKTLIGELAARKSLTLTRTSVYNHDAKYMNRASGNCTRSIAVNYGMDIVADNNGTLFRKADAVWREGFPKETCDGGSWSTGLVAGRDKSGLEDMSDARWAPIYCQTRFDSQAYGDCEKGYTEFVRDDGQKWCHKFYPDQVQHKYAVEKCAAHDSHLSGYSNQKEMKLIDKIAAESGATFGTSKNIWIGAQRRQQCRVKGAGFEENVNDPCSRERVFEWLNGVAANPPDFLPNWWYDEPTGYRFGYEEACLVLVKGTVTNWGGISQNGDFHLNDVGCNGQESHYPVCGKEAPIVLKTIEY